MSIFKKGDRVFHPETGWAIVTKESKTEVGFTSYPSLVGTRGSACYPEDELSFTEYTVEKKGFSQERPIHNDLLSKVEESLDKHTFRRYFILINKENFKEIVFSGHIKGLTRPGNTSEVECTLFRPEYNMTFICLESEQKDQFRILKDY